MGKRCWGKPMFFHRVRLLLNSRIQYPRPENIFWTPPDNWLCYWDEHRCPLRSRIPLCNWERERLVGIVFHSGKGPEWALDPNLWEKSTNCLVESLLGSWGRATNYFYDYSTTTTTQATFWLESLEFYVTSLSSKKKSYIDRYMRVEKGFVILGGEGNPFTSGEIDGESPFATSQTAFSRLCTYKLFHVRFHCVGPIFVTWKLASFDVTWKVVNAERNSSFCRHSLWHTCLQDHGKVLGV